MNVTITGRHLSVTDSIRDLVSEKMEKLCRVFGRVHDVRVVLTNDGFRYRVEADAGGLRGRRFSAHAESEHLHSAIARAENKIEAQLRRFKGRLTTHRG